MKTNNDDIEITKPFVSLSKNNRVRSSPKMGVNQLIKVLPDRDVRSESEY